LQTFLPYPSFERSAEVLDRQRLGKQRVETLQILRCLLGETEGWRNHPAVKMWRGYEFALVQYGLVVCETWMKRNYKDTCANKILDLAGKIDTGNNPVAFCLPPWVGGKIHATHQSKLISKFPEHYKAILY